MTTLPKGLVIGEDERKLIEAVLMATAEQAQGNGQPQLSVQLRRFVIRLNQSVFQGEGVPAKTLEELGKAVSDGFATANFEQARNALSAMMQAVMRMDPDPARVIADTIVPELLRSMVNVGAQQQGVIGGHYLRCFETRIKSDKESFSDDSDLHTGMEYCLSELALCAAELESGTDPFEQQE